MTVLGFCIFILLLRGLHDVAMVWRLSPNFAFYMSLLTALLKAPQLHPSCGRHPSPDNQRPDCLSYFLDTLPLWRLVRSALSTTRLDIDYLGKPPVSGVPRHQMPTWTQIHPRPLSRLTNGTCRF